MTGLTEITQFRMTGITAWDDWNQTKTQSDRDRQNDWDDWNYQDAE